MTPTPRELAMAAYQEWADVPGARNHADFLRVVSNAIASAITDQTAALQAALEDLEKCRQERDGLAAKLFKCEDCGGTGYIASFSADGWPEGAPCDHVAIVAAHDRQVAARVLREVRRYVDDCSSDTISGIADAYERGEREVPSE